MAETNAPTTPEPKADRPVGTMSRLSNAKVLLVGIMVVSLATAGFAFAPSLLATNPSDSPSALESDSFQPTPVKEDETIWSANGEAITRAKAQEILTPYASQQLIDALADPGTANPNLATNLAATMSSVISADLIAQAVAEAKVGVSDEEVQAKLKEFIAETFTDEAAYQAALKQFDITEAGMIQQLRFPMEAERLTDARYPIDEATVQEQIQPLYDERYKSGKVVRMIQFATVEEADKVMARVIAGEDFAKLAEEHSTDKRSAKKGGLMGPFQPGVLDEAFDNAVNGTEVGKTGGPFETSYGWHIIKVEGVPPLDEVREELAENVRKGIQADNWVTLAQELETHAKFTLDPRFGRWKGMAFGGITPAFEARLQPQAPGTFQPNPSPSAS